MLLSQDVMKSSDSENDDFVMHLLLRLFLQSNMDKKSSIADWKLLPKWSNEGINSVVGSHTYKDVNVLKNLLHPLLYLSRNACCSANCEVSSRIPSLIFKFMKPLVEAQIETIYSCKRNRKSTEVFSISYRWKFCSRTWKIWSHQVICWCRWMFQRRRRHTASRKIAESTPCIR